MKLLAAGLSLAVLVVGTAGGVAGAQAPPGACTIVAIDANPTPGTIEVVTGEHFPPSTVIPIFMDSTAQQVGLARVGADGRFDDPIRVPQSTTLGPHTLSVACGSQGDAHTTLDVVAVAPTTTTLPTTTSGTTATVVTRPANTHDNRVVLAATAALAVAVALVLTARRRRMEHASDLVDAQAAHLE